MSSPDEHSRNIGQDSPAVNIYISFNRDSLKRCAKSRRAIPKLIRSNALTDHHFLISALPYQEHIGKLSTACGGRLGNEPSRAGCNSIPLEKPSEVNSETLQSQLLLPVPNPRSPHIAACDVEERDVELNKKVECQRKEILRLKLQLLEQKEVETDVATCKPSPQTGLKQKPGPKKRGPKSLKTQEQNRKTPVEGIPQEPSIITPALDPWPAKPDYDTLNRVLRLSHAFQSRGSSDDQLVIIEAFGQASIAVLQTCRDSLDHNIRVSLNCEDSTDRSSPSKSLRLTEGTLQWMAKVVKEIDDWVSRTGQEAEWKTWVEDVKYRIYQELYPILTLILEVLMPTSQDICGQISTTPDGVAEIRPQKSVIELRESSVSLFQTVLVYFEPEITISLASNVLTRLRPEIWSTPSERPPVGIKPATFMSRHMGVNSGTTASQFSRLRTRSIELAREESVICLVNGLRSFCYGYSSATIIPEKSNGTLKKPVDITFKGLDSCKSFSRCAAQLQELKQTAGETLESIWDVEHRQMHVVETEENHDEKQFEKPGGIKTARKFALSESSKRDLVSVLEQIWVL